MSSPQQLEERLRAAARSWPGGRGGDDETASLSPDRRTGLVAELRRRRLRRARAVAATTGVIVAGALALVIVPGSGGPPPRSAAQSRTPAANVPTSGTIACVTLRIGGGTRECAGTLTSGPATEPSAAFGTAAHAAETTATVHVEVGNQVAVALPSAGGLRWTAVTTAPFGSADAQRRSLSTAPAPASPMLATVSHHRGNDGGATTTFRAVSAGTVILTASASGSCPPPRDSSCPANGAHWQVVVTIGNAKRTGTS